MKGIAGELASLFTVLAIPAGIAAIFPFSAIGFRASPVAAHEPSVAFVTLSEKDEAAAMRAAKASWQGNAGNMLRVRADLFLGDLPGGVEKETLHVAERNRPPCAKDVDWTPPPYLPSLAAPPPQTIPEDAPEGEALAFPKEELLSLEQIERKENAR
ncbi:MAG: hypothetical protein IKF72_12910 [Kiritimatiellae bacterium]|nr:hypothetical protein [Kiritimatiellia bacterium]